ncbi:E3 ubiquitin-protein ligase SIRP1 [Cardamine amara subsp. amara]|uniref:RING-type E3 ubiquitin transferase n=1 Tax=Cardamine amara subsp. amara TaxID=228776 RepID=A0ABD0ZEB3_CARAN
MEEAVATRYWCHMCSQTVNPVMEAEIKCPFCQSGFVEEMEDDQDSSDTNDVRANNSLWAPILMELMNDPVRRRRNQSVDSVEDNQNDTQTENETEDGEGGETDLDWQLQEILRRRRRHSAAVLQLLQGIRAGLSLESETNGNGGSNDNNPERVILINPFTQTITVQNIADMESVPAGSLGDYFIGPGFEMLLQRLAENDPNRYGTPPARKEAVEALATVKIEETLQCSVCLEDFEIGTDAKQMPCKHNFHGDCLFPWLELHSSCPVCRHQLPAADEPKTGSATTATNDNNGDSSASATTSHGTVSSDENNRREEDEEEENEEGDTSGFSIPWPFSTLFSSSQDSNESTGSS